MTKNEINEKSAAATVLTDERIDEITKAHSTTLRGWEWSGEIIEVNGYREYEFARDIERAVLAHAGKAEPDWRQYHSTLSQCAELLDNMKDGDPITDTPRFLAAKLQQVRAQALKESAREVEKRFIGYRDDDADLAEIAEAIRSLVQQSTADKASEVRADWISVADRLPDGPHKAGGLGVEVLIWPPFGASGERTAFFGRRVSHEPWFYKYGATITDVTHWMPIPEAPSTADSAGTGLGEGAEA